MSDEHVVRVVDELEHVFGTAHHGQKRRRLPKDLGDMDAHLDFILPKVVPYGEDLREGPFWWGKRWKEVRQEEGFHEAILHIFNEGGEYMLSSDGNLMKGTWRQLSDYNSLVVEIGVRSELFDVRFMNVEFMITSKRKLLRLVNENFVTGWDDPRMPTISGMRRRGYPSAAIRTFCEKAGVAKRENTIEINLLEACVREELNRTADRAMVVLDPIKVIITNYPESKIEKLISENNPEDTTAGTREISFSRELYIEREDFMENAPPKYFRMTPGTDVRLKNAYILHCTGIDKDANGEVVTIYVTYYPDSKSGEDTSGIKPKGTLHWVCAINSKSCEIRLYDRLFTKPDPTEDDEKDFLEYYNVGSLKVIRNAIMESGLAATVPGKQFQFLRQGYFCTDTESTPEKIIFNRTVVLKDSYAKEVKKN